MWKATMNVQLWWAKLMLIFIALQQLLWINCFPLPAYLPHSVHAGKCSIYLISIPAIPQWQASQLGCCPLAEQKPERGWVARLPHVFSCCCASAWGQLQKDAGCVLLSPPKVFVKSVESTGGCLAVQSNREIWHQMFLTILTTYTGIYILSCLYLHT